MKTLKLFPLFLAAVIVIATAQDCKKIGPETPEDNNEQEEKNTGEEDLVPADTLYALSSLDSVRLARKGIKFFETEELRGVWVTSVQELDWPMGNYEMSAQKALYRKYLDLFERLNINAVFFQVRPHADAFYDSEYEPWSAMITSVEGRDPGYDVLQFLLDETHARGMQFHAWMNPYRISKRKNANAEFPELDPRIPAELTKDYAKVRIYNPALPGTHERIAAIVKDIITKYDVDGIHFDDFFYPELTSGETMNDETEFLTYREHEGSIEEFRRNCVEKMVTAVHNAIKETRPEVIFSISPAGNYDYCYETMYFDIETTCSKHLIDIIIPQLYWSTAAPKDYYTPRLNWFKEHTADVPMLIGYAIYRFGSGDKGFESADEFLTERNLAAKVDKVKGGVFFRTEFLQKNLAGITTCIQKAYSKPARLPQFGYDTVAE